MKLAALLILALIPQENKGEEFTKFKKGTQWIYDKVEEGDKGRLELKVLEIKDGKTFVESKEYKEGEEEPKKTETLVWYIEKKMVCWAQKKDDSDDIEPLFKILKVGAKKGDTWVGMGGDESPFNMTATHMGTVEVKVPAGTYKNAIHIQMKMDQEGMLMVMDAYLVPKIGMIKFTAEMKMDGDEEKGDVIKIVLRKFKAAE